jgi:hypothetical protein
MARKKSPPRLTVPLPNRLPLAGQCSDHEARMREKLIEQFKPADAFEEMWIEDIAYCSVAIEHDRALIAAFVHACVRRVHANLTSAIPKFAVGEGLSTPLDPAQAAWLDMFEAQNFTPVNGVSYLGERHFVALLGQLGRRDHYQLRQLQMMLQQELAERDRLINQLKRSRRQAMIDAIEFAELEARRAASAPLANAAEPGAPLLECEDACPDLEGNPHVASDLVEGDGAMADPRSIGDGGRHTDSLP